MKKLIRTVIIMTMVFSMFITTAEARELNRDKAIKVLVDSGWTYKDIDDLLTEDALLEFSNAKSLGSSVKYIKVTEDEVVEMSKEEMMTKVKELKKERDAIALSEGDLVTLRSPGDTIQDPVITTDGYMSYYVQTYDLGGGEYMLSARYEWLINPNNRREDVFGLGHDVNLTQLSTYTPYYVYKTDITDKKANGTAVNYTYETNTPNGMAKDVGGTVVKQDLRNNATNASTNLPHGIVSRTAENHRGYLQYKVKVNNTSVTSVSIYSEYLHQQYGLSVSPSISYPLGASIGVSSASKFKRMSPNPYLSFDVK